MKPVRRTCRIVIWLAMAMLLLNFSSSPLLAQEKSERDRSVDESGQSLITDETESAINRGLAWLAVSQHTDGSFGSGSTFSKNVGVTALCGMAFLSAGHSPGRGKYGENVQRALDFILSRAKQNSFIVEEQSKSQGPMYGHGFATLFLAEVYGTCRGRNLASKRKKIRETLERAVKLIIDTQNEEGGWRYYPQRKDADLSVTVCQVMALRAAKNAGIHVPKTTIDACTKYVKRSQNTDGGFRYQFSRRAESAFPRSAAGIVALYSAGIYQGPEIEKGLKYLMEFRPHNRMFRFLNHYFYGHYYAVQAMWHAGGDYWFRWYPTIRDELISRQQRQGQWHDPSICSEYSTGMALLILQLPNNMLPIFQR